jgi:hypothetical protein
MDTMNVLAQIQDVAFKVVFWLVAGLLLAGWYKPKYAGRFHETAAFIIVLDFVVEMAISYILFHHAGESSSLILRDMGIIMGFKILERCVCLGFLFLPGVIYRAVKGQIFSKWLVCLGLAVLIGISMLVFECSVYSEEEVDRVDKIFEIYE